MSQATGQAARKEQIRSAMAEARARTLRLLDCVPDHLLNVRVHFFYSPIGWHFGHIGMTEELWVQTEAVRRPPLDERLSFLFANIPENPKDHRVNLPPREAIVRYLDQTRAAALRVLDETDVGSTDPLLHDGYAWEFAYQHECQHQETIVELMQLHQQHAQSAQEVDAIPWTPERENDLVSIPGGSLLMGSNDPHAYDNEKREHSVEVAPFQMQRMPVTAFDWSLFIADGGYTRNELWSDEGWSWREAEKAERPEYWTPHGDGWAYFGPHGLRPLHPDEPVTSTSWFEADAYARWAGLRLPTEAEWEYAARFDPSTGRSRVYPWGDASPTSAHADFGLQGLVPRPAGSHPRGASAFGLLDMAGGAWEWTSTPFLPYPGFRAFPYDGYSKDHMDGKHFVCRGGSWVTSARILRSSFRNWYVPTYRQGFLGLRCAR